MFKIKKKTQVIPSFKPIIKDEPSSFSKSLYKNSNLLRVVLHKPIKKNIALNKWYRIGLSLVTEMGLLMDQHPFSIKLSCNVLYKNKFHCEKYQIHTRPIQDDAWNPEVSRSEGFHAHKPIGGVEFKITSTTAVKIDYDDDPFYISLMTKEKDILPLTVGPIWVKDDLVQDWSFIEDSINELEGQQYRTLQSSLSDSTYFLLKEQWDFGTPGKIWDSAIVMTDVLLNLFAVNPTYFSNKRILDLSAGTGYIGLSIAQYYQNRSDIESPKIILTDLEEALNLIDQNRKLNNVETDNLQICPLMWGDKKEAKDITREGPLDIIIASDVLYNVAHFPGLISTFLHLSDKNSIIYLCYKQRGLTLQEERSFFEQCEKIFKTTQVENIQGQHIETSTTAVRIYKLQLYQHKIKMPLWSQLLSKMSG